MGKGIEGEPRSIERISTAYSPEAIDALHKTATALGVSVRTVQNNAAIAYAQLVEAGLNRQVLMVIDPITREIEGEIELDGISDLSTKSGANIIPFPKS